MPVGYKLRPDHSSIFSLTAVIRQRQNCPGGIDKSVLPTATNQCIQVGQNCPHTNNTTNKDIISITTAPPQPLPAGGQASAVLAERKNMSVGRIEKFHKQFGLGKESRRLLSEKEINQRRQRQIKALLSSESAAARELSS